MNLVKTRRVGNSTTITIPKEFDIPTGTEYSVYKGSDGTLLLSPSKENLLEEATDLLIRERLINELGETIDRNLAELEAGKGIDIKEARRKLIG